MARYNFALLKAGYESLWNGMRVVKVAAAHKVALRIISHRARYELIEKRTGVPWYVIGIIHLRESNLNFNTWLHNGDPMRDRNGNPIRTRRVPRNRPPNPAVSFEDGAFDALVTVKGFDRIKDWGIARIAYINESYNGFGYRHPSRNIPSPYLWAGTNRQKRGKFVADGVFDPNEWDEQLGVMAVLKMILDITKIDPGVSTRAEPEALSPKADADDSPVPYEPKAIESSDAGVRPVSKSKTIWGGIVSAISGWAATAMSLFGFINNPYALAAFGTLIVLTIVGVIMVWTGYLDVRAVVRYLVQGGDDSESDDMEG